MIFFKRNKDKDSKSVVKLYQETFICDNIDESNPHILSIYNKMKTVYFKAVYKLRADKLASFLKQEFTRVRTKAEFLSDMLQESPCKQDLRSRLESSDKNSRGLKRKLDSSFEEIEKLGAKLDSVTDQYDKNIKDC